MSALILAGDEIPVEVPVRTWRDTGLQFQPGVHRRIRRRVLQPDTIVWHWTGAEGPPERVYRTLRRRGLGVEFSVSRDGVIYQYCDPGAVDARDCGSWWDQRSVGVEMVCYGMRSPSSRPWSWHVPRLGRDREVIETRLRGRKVYVADFTAAQYAAADALAAALRLIWLIPHRIPMADDGSILDRPMPRAHREQWDGGEVGHLQITARSKPDPGVPFLEHRARIHTAPRSLR